MQKLAALILILSSALCLGAEATLTGRWIFHGLSDSGAKMPLFIIEIPADGMPTMLGTTAPFEIKVRQLKHESGTFVLELIADEHPLTLTGVIEGEAIKGKTSGQLRNISFIAERTEMKELKRLEPTSSEEIEAFQKAYNNPDPEERMTRLRGFLDQHPKTALKTSVLLEVLDAALESNQPDDKIAPIVDEAVESADDKAIVMNEAAYRLAQRNRLLLKAEKMAREALKLVQPGSVARGKFLDTLGWTLYRQGNLEEAAASLRQALETSPREAIIALHLAEVYEKQEKNLAAVEAYLQAYAGGGNRRARITARELYRKEKGSLEGFHELLDTVYLRQPPLFDAGRYEGNASGPIVAELFTGSQCGPCQAADYAFDGLLTRFPEQTLNVLQYHLHIPGLDPMTNPDSIARARFYKIRSTPVAMFSGTDKRPGGGPAALAETTFQQYLEAIDAQLQPGKRIPVELQVKSEGDTILARGRVGVSAGMQNQDLRLFIALVEKTVHYTGANGVHLHKNVVRKLLNGADGAPVAGPEFQFEETASISVIEEELRKYLDEVTGEWEATFEDPPIKLNRSELAVVAFVQNVETYQILGSAIATVE